MKKDKPTKAVPTTQQLETISLEHLVPHPDQAKYFGAYGSFEYEVLKADIAANGIQQKPVVLPSGNAAGLNGYTLISGHTRIKIVRELGHKTAEVIVRYDLANATRAEIDDLFLKDNVARRQQSKLAQARAAVRLYQIEQEKKAQQKGRKYTGDPLDEGDLRDRIGKIVEMSGRNLQRYMNILRAPVEIQDAFEGGHIKLVDAARVVNLSEKEQERIACRIRAGEDAKTVFNEFCSSRNGRHVKLGDAVASFARSLEKGHGDLADRVDNVRPGNVRSYEGTLRNAKKLIRSLLAKIGPAAE